MINNSESLYNDLLDKIFAFTRISDINQSLPRFFSNNESLYISEIYILHLIGDYGLCTVTDLALHTLKTTSAISQTVTKLQRKDIVQKKASSADKKLLQLSLTPKGMNILKEHTDDDAVYYATFYPYLEQFTPDELSKICLLINALSTQTQHAIELKKKMILTHKRQHISTKD